MVGWSSGGYWFSPWLSGIEGWTAPDALFWLGGAALGGLVAAWGLFGTLSRSLRRRTQGIGREGDSTEHTSSIAHVVARLRFPACLVIPLLSVLWALSPSDLPDGVVAPLRHGLAIVLILASTWALARLLAAIAVVVLAQHDVKVRDNLRARSVHTRLRVFLRIGGVLIWTLGLAAVLITFPSIRQLGTSLLASAGIVGIVVGVAAQRTLGNFIAGIQIAITQPVRLDDAVVISGEWGWIEEITFTYVVVRIWDDRRLVVPFNTLLEQPFQNWTRTTSHLLGQVFLWADYRVPVQELRDELHRIVNSTELWDGRVVVLQVTDTSERAVQLRALVSAKDSPTTWDLRCYVRERLIDYLQRNHREALPTIRGALEQIASAPAAESPLQPTP